MKLRQFTVLAALVLAFAPGVATAFPTTDLNSQMLMAQRGGRQGGGQGGERLYQQLNLSPQQTQQLQSIRSRYQEPMRQNQQALKQANQELQQLVASNAPQDQIQSKFQQVQSLKQQMSELRFKSMMEMREVLTPEQRQRMTELMQQRKQQRQQRFQNGGGSR